MSQAVKYIAIITPEQQLHVARALRNMLDAMRVKLPITQPLKMVVNGTQGRAYITFYPPAAPKQVKREEPSFEDLMGGDYYTSHEINGDC